MSIRSSSVFLLYLLRSRICIKQVKFALAYFSSATRLRQQIPPDFRGTVIKSCPNFPNFFRVLTNIPSLPSPLPSVFHSPTIISARKQSRYLREFLEFSARNTLNGPCDFHPPVQTTTGSSVFFLGVLIHLNIANE